MHSPRLLASLRGAPSLPSSPGSCYVPGVDVRYEEQTRGVLSIVTLSIHDRA